jgi:hypothetical protein
MLPMLAFSEKPFGGWWKLLDSMGVFLAVAAPERD